MIDLHHRRAQAPAFREDGIDAGGSGIYFQLLTGQQRIGIEMTPRRGQFDARNEGHAAAVGIRLAPPVPIRSIEVSMILRVLHG